MNSVKPHKSFAEQVEILIERGFSIPDKEFAGKKLQEINYYRLSGYWYPMRKFQDNVATNDFLPEADFNLLISLYDFDSHLRQTILSQLAILEIQFKTLLGYELGKVDPLIHYSTPDPQNLSTESFPNLSSGKYYDSWMEKFRRLVKTSKEEFVRHHMDNYNEKLPIWVAVELLDWGGISFLYKMSPLSVREQIARYADLTAHELESWLHVLNLLRNLCAHNARIYNRSFTIRPVNPRNKRISPNCTNSQRLYGQLSLIQYLLHEFDIGDTTRIPSTIRLFPENSLVPFSRLGFPPNWESEWLWQQSQHENTCSQTQLHTPTPSEEKENSLTTPPA